MAATSGFDVRQKRTQSASERSVGTASVAVLVEMAAERAADVGAGAEAAALAGHHDRADRRVVVEGADRVGHLGRHARRPGVQPIGPVQRDQADGVEALDEDLLVVHAWTVVVTTCDGSHWTIAQMDALAGDRRAPGRSPGTG